MRTLSFAHLCFAGALLFAAPCLSGENDPVRVKLDE